MSTISNFLSGNTVLAEKNSEYNGEVRVVRTLGFGTYIQAGGLTQSGGVVEDIWKEVLKKLKKSKQLEIKKALILGLGGGTVAKLIHKYWPGMDITGVEIDKVMIQLGQKYLGLKDVEIKIRDAANFPTSGYDLVIVDLYHGDQFPQKFEEEKFLKKLTKNKIVVINRLYYGEKRSEAVKFGNKLEKIFPKVTWFYPQANLMFICGTR